MAMKIFEEVHYKPAEVADKLRVHTLTILRWLREDVDVEEEKSKRFPGAFQTRAGRWWIPAKAVGSGDASATGGSR